MVSLAKGTVLAGSVPFWRLSGRLLFLLLQVVGRIQFLMIVGLTPLSFFWLYAEGCSQLW